MFVGFDCARGLLKCIRSGERIERFSEQDLGVDAGFFAFTKTLLLMGQKQSSVGPASLLKKGTSWLDKKVVFVTSERQLAEAALMVWKITYKLREVQGARRISISSLSSSAGLRRQTVAEVLMGVVWPDTRTILRLCAVLDVELTVIDKE